MKKLQVTLPDSLLEKAEELAAELGENLSDIFRRAVKEYIVSMRKRKIEFEMKKYAQTMAGHSGEFVKETGAAVSRKILRESRW